MATATQLQTTVLYVPARANGESVATELERQSGFTVTTVESGPELVRRVSAYPEIACVVVEHDPPQADGLSRLETIRSECPALPVVLYTTEGSESLAASALSAGASGYLARGDGDGHVADLDETIRDAIESRRPGRELHERAKELEAIQSITQVLSESVEQPLSALLTDVVQRITPTLRYPEIASARLAVDETTVSTDGYSDDGATLTAWEVTAGGSEVRLDVAYDLPEARADDLFLHEEQTFLDTVVTLLRGNLERRAYLDELEAREQVFSEVAENLHEVVWITDPLQRELLYVNPAYETVWGRSTASLFDDPHAFLDAVHPDDRGRVEQAVLDESSGYQYDEEYRILRPDGQVRWIHDRGVPIRVQDDELTSVVGLAEDITPRKERDQQVAVLSRVLRHNLRNEVNAIQAYAELVSDHTDQGGQQYVERIQSIASRLMSLAEKNRVFAEQLTRTEEPASADLSALLSDVVSEIRQSYPGANITLTAPSEAVTVQGQLTPALEELLENAVVHSDDERPDIGIAATVDDEIQIRITDDGPGIPAEEWAVLGDDEEPLWHGSGLGLWLAHWLVTGAGGRLVREEADGGGTTVVLSLPRPAGR